MPHYQRFKEKKPTPRRTTSGSRYYHNARSTSYHNMHRMRSASKRSAVNPLVVKLSIVVLVFALLFGFIKSGASSSFGRIIKIGNKDKNNISSIEADQTNKNIESEKPDEERINLLRNLSFKIFAKPEGDDSVIHEVAADEGTEDEQYISTVVKRTSLDDIENSYNNSSSINNNNDYNNDDNSSSEPQNENSILNAAALRELFGNTNTINNNNTSITSTNNNLSLNNNTTTSLATISESIIANIINQSNTQQNNNYNTAEQITADSNINQQQTTTTQEPQQNIASQNVDTSSKIIETTKFDEILSPREEALQTTAHQFIPARTPGFQIDDENSSKEYQQEVAVITPAQANKIINNNQYYNIENTKTNTTPSQRPSINASIPNQNNTTTEPKITVDETPKRTDVVEIEEISNVIDNINSNLANSSSQSTETSSVQNVNNNIQSSSNNSDNSWNINIERENSDSQTSNPSMVLRGSRTQPAIFLAQYDERRGNITIIPQERNMSRNTTLEEAILMLLEGAREEEYNNNIISLISKNTSLLDLFVNDDTVYLNFSDDFEYNPLGDEGIVVQIYQIVYTATQFEGINKVIFLINGEQKEFIGSEGQILNKEFTRMEVDTIETEL